VRRVSRLRVLALAALALLLLLPGLAVARPGGGQSYSGGGGHGGGGGGGDGGGLIWLLLRLWIDFVIAYPQFGIPLTMLILVVVVRRAKRRAGAQSWDTAPALAAPPRPAARGWDDVRRLDPQFSGVLFEDFVYALYAQAHQARAQPDALAALAPYLSQAARAQLAARPPAAAPVHGVVIGALRVVDVAVPAAPAPGAPGVVSAPAATGKVVVVLEFESNMTVGTAASEHTQYVRERWRLVRDAAVHSKPPEAVRTFHCPNCGAPWSAQGGDRCEYCGQAVTGGRFDWSVETIELLQLEDRAPALTGTVAEVGTSWPTVFHPALAARRAELLRDDPAATDEAFAARLKLIYDRLNAAWTALDLAPARPFVSDRLFDYLRYWIEAYRQQGLRNVLEGMRLMESTLAKVERDRYYDALTYRIWGTGRDYTVRQATGDVVAGDRGHDRVYSEYWTLIRAAGVRGAPSAEPTCPNCGAPVEQINMAGECQHCGAKVTRGDFDWVLSKIEQDDSYSG
jgi:DNA-directed RNA polymerase subunit RPC12/RpoP